MNDDPALTTVFVDRKATKRKLRKSRLVVEDGPTLTHGEMTYGAGTVAAEKYGASDLVDPRPFTVGTISETFEKYPEIGTLLPAMGYGDGQMKDLETTINNSDADLVIIQDLLGHNQIRTTQRYCKVSNLKVQRDYHRAIDKVMMRHDLKKRLDSDGKKDLLIRS